MFDSRINYFQLPRKIIFGIDSSKKVSLEAKALGGNNVLLVTDENLRRIGLLKTIEETLIKDGLNVDIFSEVEPEPRIEVAENVAETVREGHYDLIVGVGGGSVLDMAKAASIAATNPGPMKKYVGVDTVSKPGLPKILMPTTAGTGSEVTNVIVVTLPEEEEKSAIISPYVIGDAAIVDPKLTFTMPPRITAITGLDALSHAFEALMSIHANPITDTLALQSIRIIFTCLPRAYKSGDVESRFGMSLGSLMAGMSFGNAGVCLGHAAAYAFAVAYKVPHGLSCGLSLPYIFKFNASAISHKLPQIAEVINTNYREHVKSLEELGEFVFENLLKLLDELDIPKRLRDIGVPERDLKRIAGKVLTFTRLINRNPKPLSEEDSQKLLGEMW